ncbi:MAG: hypothetical protein EZS28_027117, partial [Streblomastix strix]
DEDKDQFEDDKRHRQIEKQKQSRSKQIPIIRGAQSLKTLFHSYDLIQILKPNQNIDNNYISPQQNILNIDNSPHPQQHSSQPLLQETLAILRTISPGDPRGYKEREPETKKQKLQQYKGLMEVIESFHDTMKLKIEEEKLNLKVDQPGKTRDFPNKDGPVFFYRLKNYRSTPIPRNMDLILPEDQWEQFDGDMREGVNHFCL